MRIKLHIDKEKYYKDFEADGSDNVKIKNMLVKQIIKESQRY